MDDGRGSLSLFWICVLNAYVVESLRCGVLGIETELWPPGGARRGDICVKVIRAGGVPYSLVIPSLSFAQVVYTGADDESISMCKGWEEKIFGGIDDGFFVGLYNKRYFPACGSETGSCC